MEQQEITVCAAITISGPLVYHLIRWNVYLLSYVATIKFAYTKNNT